MTEPQHADDAGRYTLDSRIATGGMGEVWRGTDSLLGRPVAIKLLKTEYADDATFRTRFETEARNAAALHHPGIAAVFDVGERSATDGSGHPRPFLVMELVEGEPLSALIGPDRELDPDAVKDLLAQVGEALGAAHRAGIVHRDVKPANLLVTPAGQVKVTDFGIARAADAVGITRTGAVMGTPQYLSPEQAEGKPATAASDVYALGVVAFECLAGRRPFDKESSVATALAHVREPVPTLPPGVPGDLAAVVTRALAKDPADRYADGAAFAAALRDPATAVVAMPPTPPTPPVAPPPVVDTSRTQVLPATPAAGAALGPAVVTTTTDQPAPPPQRRNPWPIVAAVLVLVALVAVAAILLTQGDGDEEPSADQTSTRTRPPRPQQTEQTSQAPETVRVVEGDYVGRDVDEVEADLRGLGLDVQRSAVENTNPDVEGQVTSVNPSGDVEVGSPVTVFFAGDAPEPPPETEEPTEEPPPETEEPTEPSEPSEPTEPTGEPSEGLPSDGLPTEGVQGRGPGGEGPPGQGPPGQGPAGEGPEATR